MRRSLRISAWLVLGVALLCLTLGAAVMLAGRTNSGLAMLERLTYRLTAGYVKVSGLGGSFPTRLTLAQLELIDRGGVWLTADQVVLSWSPLRLLERRIQIDELQVARLRVERAPLSSGSGGGKTSIPQIEVGQFSLDRVELGAPLVGTPATLSARGAVRLRSLEDATADLVARRLDGEGDYTLHLEFDAARMNASLAIHEPASGPLENLVSLPGLGALTVTATLNGPRNAELIAVALAAGDLHASLVGRVDLGHAAADVEYSLNAPAMAPRPDVAWSGLALTGRWHGPLSAPNAAGRLEIKGLRIAGTPRLAALTANLAASSGEMTVSAVLQGLEIPGAEPHLLGRDPLRIDAAVQMNEPSRPLQLTATHPLFSLQAQSNTQAGQSGEIVAAMALRLPDLRPFAEMAGQDIRGNAVVDAHLVHKSTDDALTVDANLRAVTGSAEWVGLLGPQLAMHLGGSLSADKVTVDSLRVASRAATLTASGSALRGTPDFIKDLQARWQLDVAELSAISSDLAGNLRISGNASGAPASLSSDATLTSRVAVRGSSSGEIDASLHARGLPGAPSGTLRAHGVLDGASLNVDAAVERNDAHEFRLLVRQADWKSTHLDGDLTADAALTRSRGALHLRVGQLSDFNRLLGMPLSGKVDASIGFLPGAGKTQAQLRLDAMNLALGQFAGNVHVQGQGVSDRFGLQLSAELPALYGTLAKLAATADLNVDHEELRLASTSLDYRGETVKLLAPVRISFAKGVSIDDLLIGVRDARFELKGQVAPALELDASLRKVKADLIDVLAPGLLASGTVEAQARLRGSPSSPTGSVRVSLSDVRFADDAATGLPPLDAHMRAELAPGSVSWDSALTAGAASRLTVSGTAPFDVNGPLDVKLGGKLDVGMVNPLLEARGMRATGELTVDATVTGTANAPQVGGGATLAQGSLRDYGRGMNLTDITAELVGNEGALRLKSFKASAASGTLGMTGTLGILQPKMPLDVTITANNAQPIASSTVTANLDANLHVSGTLRERLDVVGTVHVRRATIGIPNSLPPDVAVLDVKRRRGRGTAVQAPSQLVVGVDMAIEAPQQILVQGRGLDAEMGGEIHLSGTTDSLLAAGGFDLQRGSFSLSGTKLTFTQGRVSFDGVGLKKKIDPTLDFTAQTTLGETTATLRITGVADAPKFDFSSSPVLPQDEIMGLLLFGQPNASSLTALQLAQIGAALATLGGVGGSGSNPLVKLQKSLGLDRLTVGANTTNTATGTESSGAAIQAGRYVSKRVYIEGKQSTTGSSQVQVDVDLTKHLKLQTRLGNGTAAIQGTTPENDPGSSVGLSYQFEY